MKLLRKRVFQLIITVICLIAVVTLSRSIIDLVKRRDVIKEREAALLRVEAENAKLKSELNQVQSPEFIERQAREKLGLVKEGEAVVFLPQSSESGSLEAQTDGNLPNWKEWWKLFF